MCSEGMKMAASRCGFTRLLLPVARTTLNTRIRSVHEGFRGPKYDEKGERERGEEGGSGETYNLDIRHRELYCSRSADSLEGLVCLDLFFRNLFYYGGWENVALCVFSRQLSWCTCFGCDVRLSY